MSYQQLNCDLEFKKAICKAKADGVRTAVKLLKEAERNLDKTKPGYMPNVGLLGNLEIIFGWEIEKIEGTSIPSHTTEA